MAKNKSLSGSVKLRPRARLISLLGDELISDEPVAIVELVKNAYDADAKKCEVIFEGDNPDRFDRIIVKDDGIGMDLDTVLHGWMEPGTILKREKENSPGGRIYQGAKGIGRFATARLAEELYLETRSKNKKESIFVIFGWGDFEKDSFLDEIQIEYELTSRPTIKHGTVLTLEKLKKDWSEDDYNNLSARLSRLVSPFKDIKGFSISLMVPSYPEMSGEVQAPELILDPKYKLTGKLDSNGYFNGKLIVSGEPEIKFNKIKLGGKDDIPLCGPFEVEIRAWDRDREGLTPFIEKYAQGIQQIRKILNTYCGVSIYRDGFRVYPYGQQGNDWLNLDIRSRLHPVLRMANNQIVGSIRISRKDNPELKDTSHREGMVKNSEHDTLQQWFIKILALLEDKRYAHRPRREDDKPDQPLFESFDIEKMVTIAKDTLGTTHLVTKAVTQADKQIKEGLKRVQETFSRLLMSAGLGHMVDIVIHEIGSPLGKTNRQVSVLEKQLIKLDEEMFYNRFEIMFKNIKQWLAQIHLLRQKLEPQTPAKRGRATTFKIMDDINDNFTLYESLISRQNINYKVKGDPNLKVRMSRASLDQIVANLIDNSIYWLVRENGAGKGGNIIVKVKAIENGFRLYFSDDGPGVSEENLINIFEPYYSTKPDGMGLGLYIARLIIENYGKLTYSTEGDLSGACFVASFERRVGL